MLYIDSADRGRIAPLLATGLFAGVTTNPAILHRAGLDARDLPDLAAWLRDHGVERFYAQATGSGKEELRASAARIAALGPDVVIKLVSTVDALTVAKELTDDGREVLVTAVYHPTQALLAAAAGAQEIAPYVGRATERGRDGVALVRGLARLSPETRILAASLRSVDQLAEVFAAGADDATLSTELASALLDDELTRSAAEEFEDLARSVAA